MNAKHRRAREAILNSRTDIGSMRARQIGELLLCFLSFPGVWHDVSALRNEGSSNASLTVFHVLSTRRAVQLGFCDADFPFRRPPYLRTIMVANHISSLS